MSLRAASVVLTYRIAFVAIAMAAAGPLMAQRPAPVRVYITSAGAMNGFTDPSKDNRDTVKDLRDSIRDKKGLVLAESRDDAKIVLVVVGRETAQVTAGFLGDPARDRIIRVKLIVNGSESELTASAQGGTLGSGGAWGKAAGKIAKQVDEWVTTNRPALDGVR